MKLFGLVLLLFLILVSGIIFTSPDFTTDYGDGLWHFLFAKYAWQYPGNLFDLWAKPIFTFLASPFAQFGFKGVHFFQLLLYCIASISCFTIAKKLELKFLYLLPLLVFLAPVAFPLVFSALTEPLFATICIAAIALIFNRKIWLSVLLVSFLPYTRQEGYLILSLFLFFLILQRKLKYIPGLLFGSLILSIAGGFYHKDFLWLITQYPYKASRVYGHGDFLHFVNKQEWIFGMAFSIAILIGIAFMLYELPFRLRQLFSKTEVEKNWNYWAKIILVYGSLIGFFMGHTIMWWKGWSASYGLLRVMECIIPLAAIVAIEGMTRLQGLWKWKFSETVLAGIFSIVFLFYNLKLEFLPLRLGVEEVVVNDAGKWCLSNGYTDRNLYYLHPFTTIAFDIVPFNFSRFHWYSYTDKDRIHEVLKSGELFIWDSHYSALEGETPVEKLKTNSELTEIFHSRSKEIPEYEVYVFERK